jgi:hypothetical protein
MPCFTLSVTLALIFSCNVKEDLTTGTHPADRFYPILKHSPVKQKAAYLLISGFR